MQCRGNIVKMLTENGNPVQYYLNVGETRIHMNEMIGKRLIFRFLNEINCINCGEKTTRSYHHGYCYNCFISLPQTDEGILSPEKDRSHEGISRDMAWAKENTLTDHYVYLALTSNLKVGVTRAKQVTTRWIDQGASQAIRLAKTPYRKLAGDIEVFLKDYMSDRTQWKQMLLSKESTIDLVEEKAKAAALLPPELSQYLSLDNRIQKIVYPGQYDFKKIYQRSFDKEDKISGTLIGIRGQYLIFEEGFATNIRRHNGYLVELSIV